METDSHGNRCHLLIPIAMEVGSHSRPFPFPFSPVIPIPMGFQWNISSVYGHSDFSSLRSLWLRRQLQKERLLSTSLPSAAQLPLQPPTWWELYLRNRLPVGGGCAYIFCRCFFFVHQNYETTVLGNGWTDFHETFTKRYGGNVVWNVVPLLGESRAAAWRMANVDALRNLRYESFAITRGRHVIYAMTCIITRGRHRRLRYTTRSGRIDVI